MDLSVYPDQIAVMFLVFLASTITLHLLVFKPTVQILKERDKKVAGLAKKARLDQIALEEKLASYTKTIDQARSLARQSREEILRAAETEQKKILSEARSHAEKLVSEAKVGIQAASTESRLKLRSFSQELSQIMTQKILNRKAA